MKRLVLSLVVAGGLSLPFASGAFAAQPATPGCFGADRAAYIQTTLGGGDPGASEVGKILSGRAGENGAINRDARTGCGGDPS